MEVFLAFGSNEGDRLSNIESAIRSVNSLQSLDATWRLKQTSFLYETEPVVEGASLKKEHGKYLNCVARFLLRLSPSRCNACFLSHLFDDLHEVEVALGRPRDHQPQRPRPIDIDFIATNRNHYFHLTKDQDCLQCYLPIPCDLRIPHPRAHLRHFVLYPLADLGLTQILLANKCSVADNLKLLKKSKMAADATPVSRASTTVGSISPCSVLSPQGNTSMSLLSPEVSEKKSDAVGRDHEEEGCENGEEMCRVLPLSDGTLLRVGPQQWMPEESRCHLVGIVNLTPDSFSGDSFLARHNPQDAEYAQAVVKYMETLVAQGATFLDVGGESTSPGKPAVPFEEEIERLLPVFYELKKLDHLLPISLDTRNSNTLKMISNIYPVMLNDTSGMTYDPDMRRTAAELNCTTIICHTRGTPETMMNLKVYGDLLTEVQAELCHNVSGAIDAGIFNWRILVDPGLGYAKAGRMNLHLISRRVDWGAKRKVAYPVMFGFSRKAFLDDILLVPEAAEDAEANSWQERRDRAALKLLPEFVLRTSDRLVFLRTHRVDLWKLALKCHFEAIRTGQTKPVGPSNLANLFKSATADNSHSNNGIKEEVPN